VDIVLKYEGVWQVLFAAELFRKSTVIFPEISGKIPPEISELTTLVVCMHALSVSMGMVIPKIVDVFGWNFLGRWDTEHGELINFWAPHPRGNDPGIKLLIRYTVAHSLWQFDRLTYVLTKFQTDRTTTTKTKTITKIFLKKLKPNKNYIDSCN